MLPMKTRATAFDSLMDLSHDMDRLVNSLRADGGSAMTSAWMPTEVVETDEEIRFDIEMPGMKQEEIEITLENNVLTVAGERRASREENRSDGDYRLYERRYGRFQRSFTVPPTVDADGCSATYEDGVLRLRLPKSEEARPRRIRIGQGDGREVG